jgi:hypothetical protein
MKATIAFLKQFNAWRRGDETILQPHPAAIGVELDRAIHAAERYEKVRILNPRQFKALWDRNMKGERFDDLVDGI